VAAHLRFEKKNPWPSPWISGLRVLDRSSLTILLGIAIVAAVWLIIMRGSLPLRFVTKLIEEGIEPGGEEETVSTFMAGGEHDHALRGAFAHVLPAVGITGYFDEGGARGGVIIPMLSNIFPHESIVPGLGCLTEAGTIPGETPTRLAVMASILAHGHGAKP